MIQNTPIIASIISSTTALTSFVIGQVYVDTTLVIFDSVVLATMRVSKASEFVDVEAESSVIRVSIISFRRLVTIFVTGETAVQIVESILFIIASTGLRTKNNICWVLDIPPVFIFWNVSISLFSRST